ncbi:MAG: type II secretion system protein [bacterium]|nr:type II secretion system protein [bacterium]
MKNNRGYTLIELVVAVGLFALVMTLAAGSYILMVDLSRQAQGIATGINNLSFALETMTRSIRTGTTYNCGVFAGGGDCPNGADTFSFRNASGANITYTRGVQGPDGTIGDIVENDTTILTDPSVHVSSLMFYVTGTKTASEGDYTQPHVTIVISGTVSSGPRKTPQAFVIETGATMRGVDLTVPLAPSENPPLPTCTISVNPSSVLAGGRPALSWTIQNATSFSIDHGIGPVLFADMPRTVGPIDASDSYTGTVTNAIGSGTCSATVTVTSQ